MRSYTLAIISIEFEDTAFDNAVAQLYNFQWMLDEANVQWISRQRESFSSQTLPHSLISNGEPNQCNKCKIKSPSCARIHTSSKHVEYTIGFLFVIDHNIETFNCSWLVFVCLLSSTFKKCHTLTNSTFTVRFSQKGEPLNKQLNAKVSGKTKT